MLTRPRSITRILLAVFMLVVLGSSAMAQELKSVAIAKDLAAALDAKKLTAIAAKDPSDPEAFVAAMYFSGSQLLVVAAKYSPAVLLNAKLANKDYQEIYIDLNSAAKAGTRVFFEDLGADGLKPQRQEGKGFDSADIGGKRTTFDDQWRKDQKISEEQWVTIYADADKIYSRLLAALIKEAKK